MYIIAVSILYKQLLGTYSVAIELVWQPIEIVFFFYINTYFLYEFMKAFWLLNVDKSVDESSPNISFIIRPVGFCSRPSGLATLVI